MMTCLCILYDSRCSDDQPHIDSLIFSRVAQAPLAQARAKKRSRGVAEHSFIKSCSCFVVVSLSLSLSYGRQRRIS